MGAPVSLFAVVLAAQLFAQSRTVCVLSLEGRVIDEHDHGPLAYAEVYLPELQRGAVADSTGRYRIEGICPGVHRIRIQHLGCSPLERTLVIRASLSMDFELEHHAEELHAFEVTQRRPDENVGQAHEQLDKSAMERNAGRSLGEMLATIPGVNMLQSGPTISKPVIHGLSGNRILTLNQGIRQEDQQWGTEHAPNLDPFSSDKITVVKACPRRRT